MPIFEAGQIPLVKDESGFHGVITRIDVLNFLRKQHGARRRPKEDSK